MSDADWTQQVATALSPEVRLCRAIIAQAVQDLLGSPFVTSSEDKKFVRRQALAFLTAEHGANAWDRNHLCSLAGLDGEILRQRTIAILEGRDVPELFSDTRRNEGNLVAARALWAKQEPLFSPPATVSRPKVNPPEPEPDMREEHLAALKRMLKHGPATSRELSDAMGRAISARSVTAYLSRNPGFERDGDLWRLALPQTAKSLPDPVVEQPAA